MTNYYSKNADHFIEQYESLNPEKLHSCWSQFLPDTKAIVLDIGAGSGRDAEWIANKGHEVFAVEPAKELRLKAQNLHPSPNIHWINDNLPSLEEVNSLGYKFDLILLNAIWMHVSPKNRKRSFRKIANLLKPGGKLVITIRHGPLTDDRVMYPTDSDELLNFAKKYALDVILDTKTKDQLDRADVSWSTVVLWLPDDGTGALPLLRYIIVNDAKSSTYKLALLRILLRIADGAHGTVIEKNKNHVTLPFGLVSLYWIKAFKPLILDNNFLQQPESSGNLGFAKKGFKNLSVLSPYDLRIGESFNGEMAENIVDAINDAKNTIKKMPAFYTTYPNSGKFVFLTKPQIVRRCSSIKLDIQFLSKFGTFKIPRLLWDAMTQFACWIEPAIINEWCNKMAGYDDKAGKKRSLEEYFKALLWLSPDHETKKVRDIVDNLKFKGHKIHCVWTNKLLKNRYDIDHCIPFAHWANNDLWNMMPAHPEINRKKSDKLPSATMLEKAKENIFKWWNLAYKTDMLFEQFIMEAEATLPVFKGINKDDCLDKLFNCIQLQRIRLRTDQQLREWNI